MVRIAVVAGALALAAAFAGQAAASVATQALGVSVEVPASCSTERLQNGLAGCAASGAPWFADYAPSGAATWAGDSTQTTLSDYRVYTLIF